MPDMRHVLTFCNIGVLQYLRDRIKGKQHHFLQLWRSRLVQSLAFFACSENTGVQQRNAMPLLCLEYLLFYGVWAST